MSARKDEGLAPGTMAGAYRIEQRLGQGGTGAVYAAVDTSTQERVAVKILRRALADDEVMAARFEREARAVNEIHHPGIVDVFALGRLDDGRPYLAMSLLEGSSLRAEIEARAHLPPAEAWRIAREVAGAAHAAHAAGVVHRDLKPDNVFLERAGGEPPRVRVLDFGIAKVETAEPGAEPMKLTATGVPIGTPAYMAPEQWWGTGVSARTDQYALGAMLFEMLAGRPPFASQQFAELLQAHVHQPPPALSDAGVAVSPAVEALVARLLAKSPDDRFSSMREVIEAGDRAFAGVDPKETSSGSAATPSVLVRTLAPAPSGGRELRRYVVLHVAILVLGFAGVVAVGYSGESRRDVRDWFYMGGWGQWPIVLSFPISAVALVRLARKRAATGVASNTGFWIALFPALVGAFTTYTDWRAVLRHMGKASALSRFSLLSMGTYEANAPRFLGFSIASILFLSVAAMPGVSGMASATTTLRGALGVRRREALAAAAGLVVLGLLAIVAGAPSGALVAGAGAIALLSSAMLPTIHGETAARDELERAAAGILAVALAVAVGVTRIEARASVLWDEAPNRAARVAEILATQAERDVTTPIAALSLVVVAGVEVLRLRRLHALRAVLRPRTGTALLATALGLGIAGDFVQHGRFALQHDELRAELGAQFALFAELDPPQGDVLDPDASVRGWQNWEHVRFPPHRAPALQVTRDVVAVDGRGVAKLAALVSPEGALHVAAEIDRALAQATLEQRTAPEADLSLSVDRDVEGGALLRLLRIARGAGARRIELLLTRGPSPSLTRRGPPEIDVVIPSDFVALPVTLGDAGLALDPAARFGVIAPALAAQVLAGGGPVAIEVPAGR